MKEDIKLLKYKFKLIKDMGLVPSMRKGPTGIGYTFEYLIGKTEDHECKPDFNSIEIKCLMGYSKSDLTLFSAVPVREKNSAVNYIFELYGYHRYANKDDVMLFERKIFSKYQIMLYNFSFKLAVDYYEKVVKMNAYKNDVFYETVCIWDFKILERKLKKKLSTLAIVEGYPYYKEGIKHFKYVKITFYKLREFIDFLRLIENDKIYVSIYIKERGSKSGSALENHGVKFRIKRECLDDLFYKLN